MKREPSEIERNSQKRIMYLIDNICEGSQQIFADKVGIGKSSVSQYVNGTNFPGNKTAAKIAKAFNVSPMWVMGFDVPMNEEEFEKSLPFYGVDVCMTDDEQRILGIYRELKAKKGATFTFGQYRRILTYAMKLLDAMSDNEEEDDKNGKS